MADQSKEEIDNLPKANPALRAVLIGVGIVLLLALLAPIGLCAHHCYSEGKKREREKSAEIVRACQSECLRANFEGISPCDVQHEAASKAFGAKAKKKYSPLERKTKEGIHGAWDKIGKLRKGSRDGTKSPETQARIKALWKTVLKLQTDQENLLNQKHTERIQRFSELRKIQSTCRMTRLSACRAKCDKK